MSDQILEKWVDEIQQYTDAEKAYVELYMYGGMPHESAIRANRDGLLLFAQTLIKTAIELETKKAGQDIDFISEADRPRWYAAKSEIHLHFASKTDSLGQQPPESLSQKWYDQYVAPGIAIVSLGVFLFGLWTILRLLVKLF